jgi:hypothetical protein
MGGRLDRVDAFVYISDCQAAADPDLVRQAGVRRIVRLFAGPSPEPPVPGVEYLVLAVEDSPTFDIRPALEAATHWVLTGASRGEKTLVHCHAGISRSATIVLMYLMIRYRWSLARALGHLRRVRPQVQPNRGFLAHLRASEARLPWSRAAPGKGLASPLVKSGPDDVPVGRARGAVVRRKGVGHGLPVLLELPAAVEVLDVPRVRLGPP